MRQSLATLAFLTPEPFRRTGESGRGIWP